MPQAPAGRKATRARTTPLRVHLAPGALQEARRGGQKSTRLPSTNIRGGKGEKAPEAAGPSAPSKTARGEKAAEWTVVARRKKAVAARSTGAAKQGATKPAAAPSGGGSGGVPEKGTPSTAPPARQGSKAARKTKHLIPGGEERSAAGGELPVTVTGQGTASGSLRGKRKAQVRLPTCARKSWPLEGEKDPPPEAVRGSAEAAEPMEEAPAERPNGREEPMRAEEALRVDPLPATQQTSEAGPDFTIEGPASAEVAEGAQEGPPKEQLPRAPPSSDGDTGPEPCVAEEGAAEPAPEAEAGSADKAEPMQATPAEGPEGEEEKELPQGSLLRRWGFRPSCCRGPGNQSPVSVTVTEGAQEEPPKEQPPRASLSGGDEGSGPCAATGGKTSPEAVPGSSITKEPGPVSAAEGGEGPERVYPLSPRAKDGPETVPQPSKEGLRLGTRPSGSAAYADARLRPLNPGCRRSP
ncbi:UNVERIFIED_CONTAM: hypothetical protein FKN15_016849 [Acipenser sinensis]